MAAGDFLVVNNYDAVLLEIDAIPAGHSDDGIFFTTIAGVPYKIANDGTIRAVKAEIKFDGTDQTSRINTVLAVTDVQELIFDAYGKSITVSGTVTVPAGKKIIFSNGCKLIGTGTISGGIVECDDLKQCFATTLTVSNLENKYVSVCWFGAKSDYKYDGTGSHTDNYTPFLKAYSSLKDRYNGAATYYLNKACLYIPGGQDAYYYYYLSNTLVISADMEVVGDGWNQSILKFPNGIVGIYVRYPDVPGLTYKGGTDIRIADLCLKGSANGVTDDISHGIYSTSNFTVIERVIIDGFKGDGLNVYGSVPGSNSNNSAFKYIRVWNNSRHGIFISGPDANQCIFDHCDAIQNGEIGFKDGSFLGNEWRACHSADNGIFNPYNRVFVTHGANKYVCIQTHTNIEPGVTSGWEAYWSDGTLFSGVTTAWNSTTQYKANAGYAFTDLNQRGLVAFCYSEGGQWPLINIANNVFIGGTVAQSAKAFQSLSSYQGVLGTRSLSIVDIQETNAVDEYFWGPERFIGYWDRNLNQAVGFKYNHTKKAFSLTGSLYANGAPYFYSTYTPAAEQGRTVAIGHTLGFLNPILILNENLGTMNILGARNTAPTVGTYEVGDTYLYMGTSTSIILYRCTVAGTPGTWVTVSAGGGGGTSGLTQNQIGVGDASNLLSGSGDLTFNGQTFKINHATNPVRAIYVGGILLTQEEFSSSGKTVWSQPAGKYIYTQQTDGKIIINPDATTYGSGAVSFDLVYGIARLAQGARFGNGSAASVSVNFHNTTDNGGYVEYDATGLNIYTGGVIRGIFGLFGIKIPALAGTGINIATVAADGTVSRSSIDPAAVPQILSATATLDFPTAPAQTSQDLTISVPGAAVGDPVAVGYGSGLVFNNSCVTAFVSAADVVTVRFNNYDSTTGLNAVSETVKVKVFK